MCLRGKNLIKCPLYYSSVHLGLANLHEPDVSRQSWDPKKSEGRGFSHCRVLQLPGKVLHQVDRSTAQFLGEYRNTHNSGLLTSSDASPGWCPGPQRCRLSSPSSPSQSSPWGTRSSCSRRSSRSGENICLHYRGTWPIIQLTTLELWTPVVISLMTAPCVPVHMLRVAPFSRHSPHMSLPGEIL